MHHGHGDWYCPLQRKFYPYPKKINSEIERAYQDFVGGCSSISPAVVLPQGTYRMDCSHWVQIAIDGSSKYRAVRRMGLRCGISDPTYMATPIALSSQEIVSVGGHPENYLSRLEWATQWVKGQGEAGFFPQIFSFAEIARGSLLQSN